MLDAIERGGSDRLAVARAALEPRERRSVPGLYSVERTGEVRGLALHVAVVGGGLVPQALTGG